MEPEIRPQGPLPRPCVDKIASVDEIAGPESARFTYIFTGVGVTPSSARGHSFGAWWTQQTRVSCVQGKFLNSGLISSEGSARRASWRRHLRCILAEEAGGLLTSWPHSRGRQWVGPSCPLGGPLPGQPLALLNPFIPLGLGLLVEPAWAGSGAPWAGRPGGSALKSPIPRAGATA